MSTVKTVMSEAAKARQAAVAARSNELLKVIAVDAASRKALNGAVTSVAYAADRAGITVEATDLAGLSVEELMDVSTILNTDAAIDSVNANAEAIKAKFAVKAE